MNRALPNRAPTRSRVALSLPLVVLLAACGSSPEGITVDPDNAKIVAVHGKNAFDAFFTVEHRPDFKTFVERTRAAARRADLTSAWGEVPSLAAKGSDFLDRRVFAKAMADGSWHAPIEAESNEAAFVQGTRAAASDFAEGRQ